MALTATMYRVQVGLSDVDRGVYESLDLRLAQHPSESPRYLLTRLLAYCLEYQDGIAFSKGGLSSTEEPAVILRDPTGLILNWIEVGSPSAERLHKAAKASPAVALYTHVDWILLRREAASKPIHRLEEIKVWRLEPAFLDSLEPLLERNTTLELVRSDGHLYITGKGKSLDSPLNPGSLVAEA